MPSVPVPIVNTLFDKSDPPVICRAPALQTTPLVFASAHSGTAYPRDFLLEARLDANALRRSEDCFVDDLFGEVVGLGAPLLAARFPRVWCDANREAWELDPAMFEDPLPAYVNVASPRVAAGLGTIARVVSANEPIYRRKLQFADAEARIHSCWVPFHEHLAELIDGTVARFGTCLLVDCHSMPSVAAASVPGSPDLVLGDAHGTACSPTIADRVHRHFESAGFVVRRNEPYAGGFITRNYGRTFGPTHAVQIELNRALYMDERRLTRLPCFDTLKRRLTDVFRSVADYDWSAFDQKKGRP